MSSVAVPSQVARHQHLLPPSSTPINSLQPNGLHYHQMPQSDCLSTILFNVGTFDTKEIKQLWGIDELDDTTFSELMASVTEPAESNSCSRTTPTSMNCVSAICEPLVNNSQLLNESMSTGDVPNLNLNSDFHHSYSQLHSPKLFTEGLEWDDSCDLQESVLTRPLSTSALDIIQRLTSMRQKACPLISLLLRLEGAYSESLTQSNIPRARTQLDIDKSVLQYFEKHLTKWSETIADLQRRFGSKFDTSLHSNAVICLENNLSTRHESETAMIQLAINTFLDWLDALKARHRSAYWFLERQCCLLDRLSGEVHDTHVNLSTVKERLDGALRRATEMIKNFNYLQLNTNTSKDDSRHLIFNPQTIKCNLDDLRTLQDHLCNIQSRLSTCHLVNDYLKLSLLDSFEGPSTDLSSSTCFVSVVDADCQSSSQVCLFTLNTSIKTASQLRTQIQRAMNHLEQILLDLADHNHNPTRLINLSSFAPAVCDSHSAYCSTFEPAPTELESVVSLNSRSSHPVSSSPWSERFKQFITRNPIIFILFSASLLFILFVGFVSTCDYDQDGYKSCLDTTFCTPKDHFFITKRGLKYFAQFVFFLRLPNAEDAIW